MHPEIKKLKNHAASSAVKLKNSKIMLVPASWNWKTQKPCWFKNFEIEKLKNYAVSSAAKLKKSKIMLAQG